MNRKYNLDYLLHLQKNARLYMVGLSLMAFFMAVSLCLYLEPWEPKNSTAFWTQNNSDQVIAEQAQQNAEPDLAKKQEVETQNRKTEAMNQQEPVLESVKEQQRETLAKEVPADETAKPQAVDLRQIAGVTAPCKGSLLYGYGIGYDSLYDDYRFHDAICYQADGADIFAVADGVVKQADTSASWQIILQCGQYQVAYQGVQNCTVTSGEKVTAGQIIGTAGTTLCVKAVK